MPNRKTKQTTTTNQDPATKARMDLLKRQREKMARNLLKRRRRKSGQ